MSVLEKEVRRVEPRVGGSVLVQLPGNSTAHWYAVVAIGKPCSDERYYFIKVQADSMGRQIDVSTQFVLQSD